MEALITSILEGVFFVVFGAVVIRYLRHPTRLDRDVLLVFASVAGLFLLGIITRLIPTLDGVRPAAAVLLMAQPYLTIRLIRHLTPLPRWLHAVVFLGFLVAAAAVITGVQASGRVGLAYVVGYFVVVNSMAALAFLRAAQARVGSARSRLGLAALATFLFGASVLIAAVGSVAPSGTDPSAGATAARLTALLAGFGYLVAFVPPRFMRRIQRLATAFELNQELLALPPGSNPVAMWERLAAAARRVTGGHASLIVGSGPEARVLAVDGDWEDPPVVGTLLGRISDRGGHAPRVLTHPDGPLGSLARSAHAATAIVVPLKSASGRRGHLVVFIQGSALFVDDDLAVLSMLASRTLAAIEREEALDERAGLIATLRLANEELARASAAKSDFLAAMSHELRTPLNAIIGFSELLMAPVGPTDGGRGLDVVDHAGHIHSAGLQLLDLINEVLDLARIEAGRLDLRYDRFDLGALVRRSVLSMGPAADRAGVTIDVIAPDGAEIEGDPGRVRQVVYNLLSNAVKFSPSGGRVGVEVEVEVDDGVATVRVSDEGEGIPIAEQAQVFEVFAQGQQGRLRADGAGLGLALAQQLAEAHGGRIELASEPSRGSTFTLRLPVRPRGAPEPPEARSPSGNVLVIEDDPGMVALLRSWLGPEGYSVTAASTGRDGLDLARALVPDTILLDILLPDMDGWDVLQRLRLERRTVDVPVIVVSVVEDRAFGLALGAVDHLVKPVDRATLLERLRAAMGVAEAPAPVAVRAVERGRAGDGPLTTAALDGAA